MVSGKKGWEEVNLPSILNRNGMNIIDPKVNFSSIVSIGEDVQKLESETGLEYLKLHRGVMDVTQIDLGSIKIDINSKKIQQYSPNDGNPKLIELIRSEYGFTKDHKIIITPGGMSSLDLVISSLSDSKFWIPKYHWGSWNKILKIYNKDIQLFDEFDISNFRPESGVVMMCFPSNPTGWMPGGSDLIGFLDHCFSNNITVILDLPYYFLFNSSDNIGLSKKFSDNVIVTSSFSKDIGLSGFRIGYISTKSDQLWKSLRVRSLYKYNSINNLSQEIIVSLFSTLDGRSSIRNFRDKTVSHISQNISWLSREGLLYCEYPSDPVGPFAVVNLSYDFLMGYKISSVPLNKFTTVNSSNQFSRISVSVDHQIFLKYMSQIKLSQTPKHTHIV